jgi:hypothetical protein
MDFQPDIVHFDTISLAPYLDEIGDRPAVLNHHNIESTMLLRRSAQESSPAKACILLAGGSSTRYVMNAQSHGDSSGTLCARIWMPSDWLCSRGTCCRRRSCPTGSISMSSEPAPRTVHGSRIDHFRGQG